MGTLVLVLNLIEDEASHLLVVVLVTIVRVDISFSAHIDNKKKTY